MISYEGAAGGDEKGEPLDYFAYYDEGIVVPDRQGKGRGEVVTTTDSTNKKVEAEEEKVTEGVGSGERQKTCFIFSHFFSKYRRTGFNCVDLIL